jgi:hypothetical protein
VSTTRKQLRPLSHDGRGPAVFALEAARPAQPCRAERPPA